MKEPYFSQQFWLNRGMITDSLSGNHSWIDELYQGEILPALESNSDTPDGITSDGIQWQTGPASSLHAAGKPLTLYLPERYEPNYQYPVIIWLHSENSDEEEVLDMMPQISDQNFMAIGFRGNVENKTGCTWGNSNIERALFFSELHDTVRELRREFHIHSERIYLAGMDAGAAMAMQGMLHHPEWFAGAIAINGNFSEVESPLAKFRALDEQRVLLMETVNRPQHSPVTHYETIKAGRLLHSAGVDATSEIYQTSDACNPQILSRINHWIMQSIATTW